MPVNPGIKYQLAEEEYHKADNASEKLKALQNMYATVPKHKSSQKLLQWIKEKIAKHKQLAQKEKKSKKGKSLGIKKEGAATICIVGTTNSGKSTLLTKLTNAKPLIAPYQFTTKKPEIGTLDYKGIKLQLIEIPAIVKNFLETKNGPFLISIVSMSNLIIITFNNEDELNLIENELKDFKIKKIKYEKQDNFKDLIWKKLGLIKVYTKQPGKKPDYPPVALKKGNTIEDLAKEVHKDFLKKFKFARVSGKSVKFSGQRCGLSHVLEDEDIVELHTK